MYVEQSALRPRMNRRFRFIDNGGNAVEMEDAGKCETTKSGTNDCDRVSHFSRSFGRSQLCGLTVATSFGRLHSETLVESHGEID
jgi:hypothetical protein